MKILCTFPGRYGDLLWALPTVRAISRRIGYPVDLLIAGEFAAIVPLLRKQPYLRTVQSHAGWPMHPDHRAAPLPAALDYDAVLHLGYRGWPEPDVVRHTLETANLEMERLVSGPAGGPYTLWPITESALALRDPWITLPQAFPDVTRRCVVGFTDVYFELKYGLWTLIRTAAGGLRSICGTPGSRWFLEGGHACENFEVAALALVGPQLFLGDCSALHVLAVAMGVPVLLMEPLEARWNPIFYPLGTDGPQVTLIKGNDGRPTHDARHVRDAIESVLSRRPSVST